MNELKQHRGMILFEGILFVILGILAIALPVAFTIGTELFVGWLLLIGGIFQAYRTFQARHVKGVAWNFLTALVYIILGLFFIFYPIPGILSLTALLIAFFLVEGISKAIYAFQMKPRQSWGWLLFSGIIALIMALIIWSGWPGTAFWVIGLLVGINMLFFGMSLIFFSNEIKNIEG